MVYASLWYYILFPYFLALDIYTHRSLKSLFLIRIQIKFNLEMEQRARQMPCDSSKRFSTSFNKLLIIYGGPSWKLAALNLLFENNQTTYGWEVNTNPGLQFVLHFFYIKFIKYILRYPLHLLYACIGIWIFTLIFKQHECNLFILMITVSSRKLCNNRRAERLHLKTCYSSDVDQCFKTEINPAFHTVPCAAVSV